MIKEIKFSSQAIEKILNIEFFQNCGQVYPFKNYALTKIQAEKFVLSNSWTDYRDEQANRLSEYLHNKDVILYSKFWNPNVNAFKHYWETHIQKILILNLSEANLSSKILVKIQWDLLHYVQTQSFLPLLKSQKAPKFFSDLVEVYQQGHLPCGVTDYLEFENPEVLIY